MSLEHVYAEWHVGDIPQERTETYRVEYHVSLLERGSFGLGGFEIEHLHWETLTREPERVRDPTWNFWKWEGNVEKWYYLDTIDPPVEPFKSSASGTEDLAGFNVLGSVFPARDNAAVRYFWLSLPRAELFPGYDRRPPAETYYFDQAGHEEGYGPSQAGPYLGNTQDLSQMSGGLQHLGVGRLDDADGWDDPQLRLVQPHMRGEFQRESEWETDDGIRGNRQVKTVRWDLHRLPADMPELVVTIPDYQEWRPAAHRD